MATLAANASATQERLKVSAIPAGDYFQIDDEIVRVIDKRTTQLTILVERAYAGTTAATHSSGATLTPLYVPSTGGGGGAQLITLLGPFTAPTSVFRTLVSNSDGPVVASLAAGVSVVACWATFTEAYSVTGSYVDAELVMADTGGNYALRQVIGQWPASDALTFEGKPFAVETNHNSGYPLKATVVEDADLRITLRTGNDSPPDDGVGECSIYALVAEPAA